jgi:uncharacterized protein (TIGR02145 family)
MLKVFSSTLYSQLSVLLLLALPFGASALTADQAGEQISSKVVNKAVSETEGFINTQANKLANSFGNGNTEISISNIESGNPSYSIKTIQPLTPPNPDDKELVFVQGSVASDQNTADTRRSTINLGVGKRILVEDNKAIIVANAFVDYETSSKHMRASLGLEYKRSNFSAGANKYWGLSDKVTINGAVEEPLNGYDIRLSGQAPYAPWATIKGTHYYWDETVGDDITGNVLGIQIELSPSTSFEIGSESSNTMDRASYGKLVIKLPFDNTGKLTNFAFDSTPFRADADMDLALLEMVERSNNIRTNAAFSGGLFNGLTYQLVVSPDTGRVWLDRNLGATQVATSSTDSAAYGDLYQWGRAADGHQSRALDVTGSSSSNETTNTTMTQATGISSVGAKFIKNSTSPIDWTTADSSGSSRTSAWADGGANDICPAGFSVPTEAELTADTISATTTDITNIATAFSSFLKIPVAGYRDRPDGALTALTYVGIRAYLWSRSADGTDGRDLNVFSGAAYFASTDRAYGVSVRCIKSL